MLRRPFARWCGDTRFAAPVAVGSTRSITSSTRAFAAQGRARTPNHPLPARLVTDDYALNGVPECKSVLSTTAGYSRREQQSVIPILAERSASWGAAGC